MKIYEIFVKFSYEPNLETNNGGLNGKYNFFGRAPAASNIVSI